MKHILWGGVWIESGKLYFNFLSIMLQWERCNVPCEGRLGHGDDINECNDMRWITVNITGMTTLEEPFPSTLTGYIPVHVRVICQTRHGIRKQTDNSHFLRLACVEDNEMYGISNRNQAQAHYDQNYRFTDSNNSLTKNSYWVRLGSIT